MKDVHKKTLFEKPLGRIKKVPAVGAGAMASKDSRAKKYPSENYENDIFIKNECDERAKLFFRFRGIKMCLLEKESARREGKKRSD